MSSLKSFDPAHYMREDQSLCEQLLSKDQLETSKLVDQFYNYLTQDNEENLYEGVFSVLSEIGSGKTFFLALLYCKLLKKGKKVYYINTLDYIIHGNEDQIENDVINLCTLDQATVVLIDNIEKHSPQFILDFIYALDRITRTKKLLCILSYDDDILQQKLYSLFADSDDTERFFQNYIDIEFYLFNHIKESFFETLFNSIEHPSIKEILIKNFNTISKKNLLSLAQTVILAKKMIFVVQQASKRSNHISIIPNLPYIIYFSILKLIDKKFYKELHTKIDIAMEDIRTPKQDLNSLLDDLSTNTRGYEVANSPKVILNMMELINV